MQLIIPHELTKEKNYCVSKSGCTNLFKRKRNIGNKEYSDQIITVFSCKLQRKLTVGVAPPVGKIKKRNLS